MANINLKSDLILNKKFSIELSGYNAKEVDEYLDLILSDYRYYEEQLINKNSVISEKNDLIQDKIETIKELELEIEALKSQLSKSEESSNYSLKKEIDEIKRKINRF